MVRNTLAHCIGHPCSKSQCSEYGPGGTMGLNPPYDEGMDGANRGGLSARAETLSDDTLLGEVATISWLSPSVAGFALLGRVGRLGRVIAVGVPVEKAVTKVFRCACASSCCAVKGFGWACSRRAELARRSVPVHRECCRGRSCGRTWG